MVKSAPRKPQSHTRRRRVTAKLASVHGCRIKVLGIGRAGNRTVGRLSDKGLKGSECVAINTDLHDLDLVHTSRKVLIGESVTCGLSAQGNPRIGREAAEDSKANIESVLEDVDVAFVVAGLGGGTGSGAAPLIADIARRKGAVVVGIVTTPMRTESNRIEIAAQSLKELTSVCDTIVLIDINKFIELMPNLPTTEAFSLADKTMANVIEGIVESISMPNLASLDWADFRNIVGMGGLGTVGVGRSGALSQNRAEEAVHNALSSPFFDADFAGAKGALVHVTGGPNMTFEEAKHVEQIVSNMMGHDARVGWGANIDPRIEDNLEVTIVMTGVRSPRLLSGMGNMLSELYDVESSFSSHEKPLQLDLGLDQIETI